jgi:hypothetical protein
MPDKGRERERLRRTISPATGPRQPQWEWERIVLMAEIFVAGGGLRMHVV